MSSQCTIATARIQTVANMLSTCPVFPVCVKSEYHLYCPWLSSQNTISPAYGLSTVHHFYCPFPVSTSSILPMPSKYPTHVLSFTTCASHVLAEFHLCCPCLVSILPLLPVASQDTISFVHAKSTYHSQKTTSTANGQSVCHFHCSNQCIICNQPTVPVQLVHNVECPYPVRIYLLSISS